MPDWGSPKWRREGRTGSGPFAPKYSSRKARRQVRNDSGCAVLVIGALMAVAGVVGTVVTAVTWII